VILVAPGCGGSGGTQGAGTVTNGTTSTIVATEASTPTSGDAQGDTWTGQITYVGTLDHDTRLGAAKCNTQWDGQFHFVTRVDGSITGSGDAEQTNVHCQFKQLPDPSPKVTFTVSGKLNDKLLGLRVVFLSYGATRHDYGGFAAAFFHGQFGARGYAYPLNVAGKTAHTAVDVDFDYASGVQHVNGTLDLAAHCPACP
jgi:hypothetical protein